MWLPASAFRLGTRAAARPDSVGDAGGGVGVGGGGRGGAHGGRGAGGAVAAAAPPEEGHDPDEGVAAADDDEPHRDLAWGPGERRREAEGHRHGIPDDNNRIHVFRDHFQVFWKARSSGYSPDKNNGENGEKFQVSSAKSNSELQKMAKMVFWLSDVSFFKEYTLQNRPYVITSYHCL